MKGIFCSVLAVMLSGCLAPLETERGGMASSLPVILFDYSDFVMEARISGRITRAGSCLYLEHAPGQRALILWGDDDVRVARFDDTDWLVNNYTSGLRIREGEIVRGGGRFYPSDANLGELADGEIPADCTGPAVQLHDVAKFDPSKPGGIPDPPPPPPPAPSARDTLLSQAFDEHWDGQRWPRRTISDVADPREAMFTYVLKNYEGREGNMHSHFCLRAAEDELIGRLSQRFGPLYSEADCSWSGPGVVLTTNGESAMFVDARIDCSGDRGFCAGSGGATYGNLGAEHGAYRLRRKNDGWEIEKLGLSVVS
jgi:hypothetical protein